GRLDEARQLLELAIVKQPQEPSAHGNLGWGRLRAGAPAAALTAFAAAQALEPANAWIATMQGIAHARLGEWPVAIAAFQRAMSLTSESALPAQNPPPAEPREPPP